MIVLQTIRRHNQAMITSFSNALVKRVKRLRQKKHRQEEGVFFVEGLRVVLTAVQHNAPLDTLIYSSELLTSELAHQTIASQRARGVPCVELSAAVFQAISERERPTGLGVIVKTVWHEVVSLPVTPQSIFVSLSGISDPGNLGTILRTMDAVAAAGLIVVGQTVDPFHSTAVKASMGALFTIPISQVADELSLFSWAERAGLHTIATSAKAGHLYWDTPYTFPALLLMGSEGEGLSSDVLNAAAQAVAIPMSGAVSSLNLAVATSLMLYELKRSSPSL